MTPYQLGFFTKLAENGLSPEMFKKFYGNRIPERKKYMFDFSDIDTSGYKLEDRPGFLERNPWIFRMSLNPLNKRFGNGARLFQYNMTF